MHIIMETLKTLLRNLAEKLARIPDNLQPQECPVRVSNKNYPGPHHNNYRSIG